ncbi:hypothetical protein HK101_004089 [Irineochytrium annulatum]|nr:hypothetical protein HK101_004089 [Irineochytrium annulatum]
MGLMMTPAALDGHDKAAVLPSAIPYFDISVDHSCIIEGARHVLSLAFPDWKNTDVELKKETDGITKYDDLIAVITAVHRPSRTSVLVRTYGKGSDVLIDRKQEMQNMMVLAGLGMCPPLFGQFRNGLVYGFQEGRPLSVDDMRDSKKSMLVADVLARWHQVELPGRERAPRLFETMRRWLSEVPETFADRAKESVVFATRAQVSAERRSVVSSPDVYAIAKICVISVIDYEYGCYNPRGFDIGNHFCEYAGFDCDYSLYPSADAQRAWLRRYLYAGVDGDASPEAVEQLRVEVNQYALSAHVFWGIWALVQGRISDLDFDYNGYAQLRFREYIKRRDEFLSM